jgi:type I restriction enzyme S subunit
MAHVQKGPPIITAKNVRDGFVCFKDTHFAKKDEFEALRPKDRPHKGDLLIVKDGATIGRAAIVETDDPFCISQTVAVVWLESCQLLRPYLLMLVQSPFSQKMIWSKAEGAAMPHLSITDFAAMPIPIPPLAEQKRIVSKVSVLLSQLDELSARLRSRQSTTDALLTALIHQILEMS